MDLKRIDGEGLPRARSEFARTTCRIDLGLIQLLEGNLI
jgi:hypothetical protein